MTDHPTNDSMREEVLVGRVVDSEATPDDWAELEAVAKNDPDVWRRVAQAQRDHARLEQVVEDEIAVADLVDLVPSVAPGPSVLARIGSFGGWAVAAAVALAMIPMWTQSASTTAPGQGSLAQSPSQARIIPTIYDASPDQAFDQYIRSGMADGSVVAEMPAQLLNVAATNTGTAQRFFIVRRVVEQIDASQAPLYTIQPDADGEPALMPVTLPESRRTDSF